MPRVKKGMLKQHHQKVLGVLIKYFPDFEGGAYLPFKPIMDETGLDRRTVRLACRYLKRKGLARFYAGLCDDGGEFRGSGYSATEEALGAQSHGE